MPQIDITLPKNALDAGRKATLLSQLTKTLHKWEGVPATSPTVPWAWAYIHEIAEGDWAFGGKVAGNNDAPRYRVAITVPEGVMDADHKQGLIEEVTQVIVDTEGPNPDKSGPPLVTCLILEVLEGGYGVAGRVYHRPVAVSQ